MGTLVPVITAVPSLNVQIGADLTCISLEQPTTNTVPIYSTTTPGTTTTTTSNQANLQGPIVTATPVSTYPGFRVVPVIEVPSVCLITIDNQFKLLINNGVPHIIQ